MINRQLTLVEDAQHFYKWSSVRWQAFLAVVIALGAALQPLLMHLPDLLLWAQTNWPQLLPILHRFFPSVSQAGWILAAQIIAILLRVTSIERPK